MINKIKPCNGWCIVKLTENDEEDGIMTVGATKYNDFGVVVKIGEPLPPVKKVDFKEGDKVVMIKYGGRRIDDGDDIYMIVSIFDIIAYETGDK